MHPDYLSSIVALSPSGVMTFDAHGILSSSNDAALRMLNFDKDKLIGISDADLELEINKKCLHKIRHNGDINASLLITMDESPLIIKRLIVTNPGLSSASEIHYFYDITHETNVSEMKAELLFTLAHELRNSLSSIHGYTELLIKRSTDAQTLSFLEVVLKQTNKLNRMINEVLDLGKAERESIVLISTQKIELNAFVKALAEEYFAKRKPVLSLHPQPIFIEADKEKLSEAIINICSNAKKYSDDGSPININISLDVDSQMAGIQVVDQGIGMTPVQQSQLFTRFYRANPEGEIQGSGLGMCFVKEILELHSGGVEVHSEKGKGTQVTLWIPSVNN